ncbi:MAG TPA: sensor domain-containing diguanylate cyclase [Thermoleophilia bacterium]|nr:MAG: putative diguanylate cyclase YdaM [Actinobacteria bacterium ADurb.BinA094]HOU29302.1 sensor domain-containing diguanylate cyclase [Thermoleophilia bacterium]HQH22501.1 sensor domain-containing diguanylate cyclase [Thermoleophilia bacterium]HQJ26462.1 sensor domain-containing diguanylate cyclase [Thermoleophilia bacterium]
MKRWTELVLVACAAGVAVAQWFMPATAPGLLGILLFGLVVLTAFSQRRAIDTTLVSLNAAHREQLEGERRYRALFDACSDVIIVHRFDEEGRPGQIVEVNEAACLVLGYARSQLLSMTAEDVLAPEARSHARERARALLDSGTLAYETVQMASDLQRMPVEVTARIVEIGGRRLCTSVSHSIAAHKEVEQYLRNLTDVDELTGLLNRRGFFAKVDEMRRKAKRTGRQVLLTYFDVDGLKRVNDELGHAEGDRVLVAAADVLRGAFREHDVVARLGGDEFVATALLGRRHDEALDRQAIEVRLEQAVRAKREELGDAYRFSVSFGSVVANHVELAAIDELLTRADQSMYEVKRGRTTRLASRRPPSDAGVSPRPGLVAVDAPPPLEAHDAAGRW